MLLKNHNFLYGFSHFRLVFIVAFIQKTHLGDNNWGYACMHTYMFHPLPPSLSHPLPPLILFVCAFPLIRLDYHNDDVHFKYKYSRLVLDIFSRSPTICFDSCSPVLSHWWMNSLHCRPLEYKFFSILHANMQYMVRWLLFSANFSLFHHSIFILYYSLKDEFIWLFFFIKLKSFARY